MLNFFKKNKTIELVSPITGNILPMEEVPDKVFSDKMMGDGLAIEPSEGKILSPVDGTIVTIFPTNHAIGLESKEGLEILIHIGLDTVELQGEGFNRIIEEGQKVKKGDLLMEFDIEKIQVAGKSTITPIVITNMDKIQTIEKNSGAVVAGSEILFTVELS